jgi:hypothetical protein
MAARSNPFFEVPADASAPDLAPAQGSIARLAQMHAEAVETARLANLLGRALPIAIALPVMGVLAVVLAGGAGVPSTVAWAVLLSVASLSVARAYGSAIGRPFERASLHAFAEDLSACLLYAGFAWGAGAFLAIGGAAATTTVLLFAGAPAIVVALVLREQQAALFFLAPVAALTAFACVLRPLSGGALDAALVLIGCAAVAGAIVAADRWRANRQDVSFPAGLSTS